MATEKILNDKLKAKYYAIISTHLAEREEEVLRTNAAEMALPVVDENGNEKFIVITIKVPTGSRDGEPYDGYSMSEDYALKCRNNAEKKAEKERAKKEKIERDKKYREKVKENKEKRVT